jgi:hypothetical protein
MKYNKRALDGLCKFHLISQRKVISYLNIIYDNGICCDDEYILTWRLNDFVRRHDATLDKLIIVIKLLVKNGLEPKYYMILRHSGKMFDYGMDAEQIARLLIKYYKA